MIRIDHITDPFRFLLSMAVAGAVGTPPSPLLTLLSLVPVVAERFVGRDPHGEEPRPIRRPRPAGAHPSTA